MVRLRENRRNRRRPRLSLAALPDHEDLYGAMERELAWEGAEHPTPNG